MKRRSSIVWILIVLGLCLPNMAWALPDLVISSYSHTPTVGKNGDTVDFKVCVQNIGTSDVKVAFKVGLYSSTNDFISKTDDKITEYEYSSAADLAKFKANAAPVCKNLTLKVSINTNVQRWLGATVNITNTVKEVEDYSGNYLGMPFIIASTTSPNLVVTQVTGPRGAKPGDSVTVRVCVANYGTAVNTPFKVSANALSSGFDTPAAADKIGEATVNSLGPNQRQCLNISGKIPASLKPGILWYKGFADSDKKITEASETDNVLSYSFFAPGPDLAIASFTVTPNTANPGDKVDVKVCTQNVGGADITKAFKVGILSSTDTSISTFSDKKLLEISYTTADLAKFKAKAPADCKTVKITIDATLKPGVIYLAGYADIGTSVAEINETTASNASDATPVFILSKTQPNLVISSVKVLTTSLKPGEKGKVNVCYANYGTATTTAFKLSVYFLAFSFSSYSNVIGSLNFATGLKSSEKGCKDIDVTVPSSGVSTGTRYFGVFIDNEAKVAEASESDNKQTAPFTVAPFPQPDIELVSVKGVPASAKIGSTMTLTICLKNSGKADVKGGFVMDVYYSTNDIISTGDTKLTSFTYKANDPKFKAGAKEVCETAVVTVPAAANDGADGYIGVTIDYNDDISESNESNNENEYKFNVPALVKSDLQIDSVRGVPKSAKPGDKITVTVCVINKGQAAATNFKVGLYYSTNSTISSIDTKLGEAPIASLANGAPPACRPISITMPATLNIGNSNYLGAWVDFDSKVKEVNESNNTNATQFTVVPTTPNLRVTSVLGPDPAPPGANVTVKVCYENDGVDFTTDFKVGVYYLTSSSGAYTTLVGQTTIKGGLKKGGKGCIDIKGALPANAVAGGRYYGAWIDNDEKIKEPNETDNKRTYFFSVKVSKGEPDLIVTSISGVPANYKIGDKLNVKVCTKNIGAGDVKAAFKVSVYYSNNDFFSTFSDTELGFYSYKTTDLAKFKKGAAEDCQTIAVTIPTKVKDGADAWIVGWVDADNKITEYTTNNNKDKFVKSFIAAIPKPDLTITSFKFSPASGKLGDRVTVDVCIQNKGTGDVKVPFKLQIFNSTNDLISSFDTLLTTIDYKAADLAKFKVGAAAVCSKSAILLKHDTSKTLSVYYIGAYVDEPDDVNESVENNNDAYLPFFIPSTTKSNLAVSSVRITPSTSAIGGKVTVDVCFGNFGTAIPATQTFTLSLYYLTSATTTVYSTKLYDFPVYKGMAAGATKCEKYTVTVPSSASAGSRGIGAWIDSTAKITEASDTDNKFGAALTVIVDKDGDGVPSNLDCDDNNKLIFPAYNGKPAAKELCDGKDNNCDKQTDEGFKNLGQACSDGKGVCESKGTFVCKSDKAGTVCNAKAGAPQPEVCNGKDDNCDGKVDEGADKSCKAGETCQAGKCVSRRCVQNSNCGKDEACIAGLCTAVATCKADGDCRTGETCKSGKCEKAACKDTSECAKGAYCAKGACEPACKVDADCGANGTCKDGRCWTSCKADGDCYSSQACVEGMCQDKCATACKQGELCWDGKCIEKNCYGYACANGQICLNTACVDDKCDGKKCGADEFCRLGSCVKTCFNVRCKVGEQCVDGLCKKDACAGVQCKTGEVCLFGSCAADKCAKVTCGTARACVDGKCTDAPCTNIKCDGQDQKCEERNGGQCTNKTPLPPIEPVKEAVPEPMPEPVVDAGPVDTGTDAGPTDTPKDEGGKDEGEPDQSRGKDEAKPDTTAEPDKDEPKESGRRRDRGADKGIEPGGGCGCQAGANPANGLGVIFGLFLVFLAFRRRRN